MRYASEDLMNEHEGILAGLMILEKMTEQLKESKKIEVGDIKEMIGFFKLFADKCHHGKEEGFLFPLMEKDEIETENGLITLMKLEHEEGRTYLSHLEQSISKDVLNDYDFIHSAQNYIRLLRLHIEKENTILFPSGDHYIPPDEQKALLSRFEEFEKNVMGDMHEKLHELLHKFEARYLAS